MKWNASRIALVLALAATLLAVWFAPSPDTDSVELSPRLAKAAAVPTGSLPGIEAKSTSGQGKLVAVLRIRPREDLTVDEGWLFAPTRWQPPPAKAVAAPLADAAEAVAQVPQAPPLPFRVLGRYEESGQPAVFLQHQDQNLVVRVGDTIDGIYKVENLDQATLTLRYLPLDLPQRLALGPPSDGDPKAE